MSTSAGAVTERPILFSAQTIPAILSGRKTQTRRIIKPQPTVPMGFPRHINWRGGMFNLGMYPRNSTIYEHCPYGKPGDRLWVRETWGLCSPTDETCWFKGRMGGRSLEEMTLDWELRHRADYGSSQESCHWRPSIHMPRWASRITLEITDVRVQRLQEISTEDCIAEGVGEPIGTELRYGSVTHQWNLRVFSGRWQSIHGPGSWDANPWVWAITFLRVPNHEP